eukprot:1176422-Prorocentrum_minimum.AAC.4
MKAIAEAGCVHGDLALRNVLVFTFHHQDPTSVCVKVADYGLSSKKGTYYCGGNNALPVRWMPPEALGIEALVKARFVANQLCHPI